MSIFNMVTSGGGTSFKTATASPTTWGNSITFTVEGGSPSAFWFSLTAIANNESGSLVFYGQAQPNNVEQVRYLHTYTNAGTAAISQTIGSASISGNALTITVVSTHYFIPYATYTLFYY